MPTSPSESADPNALNTLIDPEVFQDEFYQAIVNLARSAPIDTVLEIGSSSGGGSTLAWVEGLRANPRQPKLYCMEVSRVRCQALKDRWEGEGFVECFLGSSVRPDQFPSAEEVSHFYHHADSILPKFPLEQVLGWRQADLDYIAQENVPSGLIAEIKKTRGIRHFGAVLIDGSEFTGDAELDEVYGAEFILLDDTRTYKCHAAREHLLHDPAYEMIADNPDLRHGYSIFRRRRRTRLDPLPADVSVHFFTIVLNGEPFIRYHIDVMRRLPFRWHWHIVEGAAELKHDTAWSTATGGVLPDDQHADGLSTDGTTAYLDQLAREFPENVSVYRPPVAGSRWDGKIEMVAEPLRHIFEDAVLWQIDADELWTAEQFAAGRKLFLNSPEKAAAWFWCRYFVGEELVVSTRHCYAQNPKQEWLRAWSFRPGMKWITHEPPVLAERRQDGSWKNLADGPVLTHSETEAAGLVFQHFAYATEAQLRFKERYYGYAGALEAWQRLQERQDFPVPLRDIFPWVTDQTEVSRASELGVTPLARRDAASGEWSFPETGVAGNLSAFGFDFVSAAADAAAAAIQSSIVLDGVFFQLNNTGIGRVWREILKLWSRDPIASRLWILDRGGNTAPRFPGLRYRTIPRFDPAQPGRDSEMLQQVCDELGAGVFTSTYYSGPTRTPSVAMMYDMIPELMGIRDGDWQWTRKAMDILRAEKIACISHSTAADLSRLHPEVPAERFAVVTLAAPPEYHPASGEEITAFRQQYNLPGDYLMLAGERIGIHLNTQGYKNAALAFKAWSLLPEEQRRSLTIVCAGGKPALEEELRALAPGADVRNHRFSDDELRAAYSGATALIYPSLYEGFGLPVLEAMACGCPVITTRRSSLIEVAGEAGLFVNPWDAHETAAAIQRLRSDPEARSRHIALGLEQAKNFSYRKAADSFAYILTETADKPRRSGTEGGVWEFIANLQTQIANPPQPSTPPGDQSSRDREKIRELKSKVQTLKDKVAKLQQQKRQAPAKRRPLKRLLDFLRGKKSS